MLSPLGQVLPVLRPKGRAARSPIFELVLPAVQCQKGEWRPLPADLFATTQLLNAFGILASNFRAVRLGHHELNPLVRFRSFGFLSLTEKEYHCEAGGVNAAALIMERGVGLPARNLRSVIPSAPGMEPNDNYTVSVGCGTSKSDETKFYLHGDRFSVGSKTGCFAEPYFKPRYVGWTN